MRLLNKAGVAMLLLLFLTQPTNAQTYFSNRYNFFNTNELTQQFLFDRDTFYLSTILLGDSSGLISRISLNGNLVPTNKYPNFQGKYFQPYATAKLGHNFYSTGAGGYFNTISAPFFKFNTNCDTINTKFIGDSSYYTLMQKILPYSNTKDKLLLIGATDSTCGPSHQGKYKAIIRVVDTNGILLQTKTYLSGCEYRNINAADTSEDKGYLIGFNTTFGTWGFESRLMKLDSNLNFVWDKKMTETSGGYAGIINHQNNYYYHATTIVDSVWNFTYKWERPALSKVDKNGTIIWQKYYGVKQQYINLASLKECSNGDLIVCGVRKLPTNEAKGFIIRTDSLGNLKWWKDYSPDTTPLDTTADNYLWDILELPNNDIAAVGWSSATSLNPLQQTWLLKVDSNGCFGNSNCPLNLITGIKENISNSLGLTAYPNPFKDELNINYSILDFDGAAKLQLIELASGRIIDSIELTQSFGTKQFNTQNLANGLYVLSLKQNNKPSVNFKVINIR